MAGIPSRRSPAATVVTILALSGALAGCAVLPGGEAQRGREAESQAEGTSTTQTVEVERSSFDTVISLPGTVVSDMPFQVTSPVAGRVASVGDGFVIDSDDGSVEVPVPARSSVESTFVAVGDQVAIGYPLAAARYRGFALRAPIAAADPLRLTSDPEGSRAQVDGSSSPFDCRLLDQRPSVTSVDDVADGDAYVGCVIPRKTRVLTGMTGRLVLVLDHHEDVLTLPVEAVAGSVDDALVSVRDGGRVVERRVELGGSNGHVVEIRAGLEVGDDVIVPSPTLLE